MRDIFVFIFLFSWLLTIDYRLGKLEKNSCSNSKNQLDRGTP